MLIGIFAVIGFLVGCHICQKENLIPMFVCTCTISCGVVAAGIMGIISLSMPYFQCETVSTIQESKITDVQGQYFFETEKDGKHAYNVYVESENGYKTKQVVYPAENTFFEKAEEAKIETINHEYKNPIIKMLTYRPTYMDTIKFYLPEK